MFFAVGAALMAMGAWLHLTERHEHEHEHEALEHGHAHVHDIHHQHEHEPGDPPVSDPGPHTHPHRHTPVVHTHPIPPTFTTGTDTIEMRCCELCLRRALRSRSRSCSVLSCLTRRAPLEQ